MWDIRVDAASEDEAWGVSLKPTVWDELGTMLHRAQAAKAQIEFDVGPGRQVSAFAIATEVVIDMLEDRGVQLPPTRLPELINELFSGIRSYHHDLRRSPERDIDEVPRTRDVVNRIIHARRLRRAK